MACWPSVALLRDYVCVCNVYHCSWTWWQITVQRYVALAHAQAMCLRCVCVVLEAWLAWRSSSLAFLLVSHPPPPLRFLVLGSPPPSSFFFLVSGVCSFHFHWASGLSVTGAIVGNLSKDVFERRTSTGSEVFSLFICLDANKFVLLSFFSLIKTIYPRVWTKPLPNDAKSPLPVDVRHSKTL